MAKNTKGTTENLQIGITPELKKKIDNYTKLRNISKPNFINEVLNEFFNNKVVSIDYITPDKPYYFNVTELLNNKSVIATTTKPTSNFNEYIKIVNVPNNLDQYHENYNNCFSDAPNQHKGILINCLLDETHENLFIHYLGFEFIINDPDFNMITGKQNTLKISLINENDLLNFLDVAKHKELLKELNAKEKELKEAIRKDKTTTQIIFNQLNEMEIKSHEKPNLILDDTFKEMELKPEVIKKFEEDKEYKKAMFLVKSNDKGNDLIYPKLLIDINNNVLYGNKLIKTYENYFYLRPFYIDSFINNLIYFMETNKEINEHINNTFNVSIDNLKEFQANYKFDVNIYGLLEFLKSNQSHFNLNVLFDSYINDVELKKAFYDFYKYSHLETMPTRFKFKL